MSLSAIYFELHRQAARSGEDRSHTFTGGARIAVRVKDNVTTLTIMRKGKRVGSTELVTFKRDCNVPPDAARYPADEQGQHTDEGGVVWWYVAYRWAEEGD